MNIQEEIDVKKRIQWEIIDLKESIEEQEALLKAICSINVLLRRRKIEAIIVIKAIIDKYEQK